MNILLLIPRFTRNQGEYYELPLGMGYISSVLKSEGYNVITLNLNLHENADEYQVISECVHEKQVDVVCIGGLTYYYHAVKCLCLSVKDIDQNITLIVGGGLVSSEPKLMLDSLKADFIVHGEGEETIAELIHCIEHDIEPRFVLGVGYKVQNKIILTDERPSIENLDTIPFPDFEQFGLSDYFSRQTSNSEYFLYIEDKPRLLPIITSRSCPLNCTFCYHPIGKKYRVRSLDNVFQEIEMLIDKFSINTLIILDELMTVSKKRMHAFCDGIEKYNINWVCQLKVDVCDQALLHRMRKSGCYYISYGIESASNVILDSMKKYITVNDIEVGLARTRKANIGIQGNFLFSDPKETIDTAMETLSWWRNNYDYHINLSELMPYPGSEDYVYAVKNGLISDRLKYIENGCPPLNLTQMEKVEYQKIIKHMYHQRMEIRQYGELVSIEKTHLSSVKLTNMYCLTIRCPHCASICTYHDFHQKHPGAFKLACRHCNQRFDLRPTIFPEVKKNARKMQSLLTVYAEKETPLTLTPCIPEESFLEYMEIVEFDWKSLNIVNVLDVNQYKVGAEFMDQYPVLERDKKNFEEHCIDNQIMILPTAHVESIYQELISTIGISSSRVVTMTEVI